MSEVAISRPVRAAAASVRSRRALGLALVWTVVLGAVLPEATVRYAQPWAHAALHSDDR